MNSEIISQAVCNVLGVTQQQLWERKKQSSDVNKAKRIWIYCLYTYGNFKNQSELASELGYADHSTVNQFYQEVKKDINLKLKTQKVFNECRKLLDKQVPIREGVG